MCSSARSRLQSQNSSRVGGEDDRFRAVDGIAVGHCKMLAHSPRICSQAGKRGEGRREETSRLYQALILGFAWVLPAEMMQQPAVTALQACSCNIADSC